MIRVCHSWCEDGYVTGPRTVSVSSELNSEYVSSPIAFSTGASKSQLDPHSEGDTERFPLNDHTTGRMGQPPSSAAMTMESFEANAAAQEAEDRLEQLFLEDELSDARLGFAELDSTPSNLQMGGVSSLSTADSSSSVLTRSASLSVQGMSLMSRGGNSSSSAQLNSVAGGGGGGSEWGQRSKTGGDNVKKRGSLPALHVTKNGAATLSSSSLPTHQEFTLDSSELERLEDSMAVAG